MSIVYMGDGFYRSK